MYAVLDTPERGTVRRFPPRTVRVSDPILVLPRRLVRQFELSLVQRTGGCVANYMVFELINAGDGDLLPAEASLFVCFADTVATFGRSTEPWQ